MLPFWCKEREVCSLDFLENLYTPGKNSSLNRLESQKVRIVKLILNVETQYIN
jgi:hypothetical protein